jgi:hypothetical protein
MKSVISSALTVLMLVGCANPPAANQQINHTVGLISELNKSLADFKKQQDALGRIGLDSLNDQEQRVALSNRRAAIAETIREAAGDAGSRDVQDALTAVADAFATAAREEALTTRNVNARLSELLKPLPSTTQKTLDAQKAVAAIGIELTPKERVNAARDYFNTVKKGVSENKEKIQDAEKKADAAASLAQ